MSDRRYFVSLPNALLDIDLSENALRLYLRIKREAGDAGGCCKKPMSELAKLARMGKSQAIKARNELSLRRKELGGKSLIRIQVVNLPGTAERHEIKIVDVWPENMNRYARKSEVEDPDDSPGPDQNRPVPNGTGSRYQAEPGAGPIQNRIRRTTTKNKEQGPSSRGTEDKATAFREAVEPTLVSVFGFATRSRLAIPEKWTSDVAYQLRQHFDANASAACAFLESLPQSDGWQFRKRAKDQTADWITSVLADARHSTPEIPNAPPGDPRCYHEHDGRWIRSAPSIALPKFGLDAFTPVENWPPELQAAHPEKAAEVVS